MSLQNSRRIVITGAAGFIGAGLARALAVEQNASLLLLDQCEQGLVELETSLADISCKRDCALANVGDRAVLRGLLERWQPTDLVHAAAYKNVVALEQQPEAAIRNNTLGSFDLASAARDAGAENFLLVSTDKAVAPHSIMGASKRAAELLTMSLARRSFRVNAIRLGNVLGSTGSVVPLFERQLRAGKPLTVTDAKATRWFYSLDETTALLRVALRMGTNQRIFVPAEKEQLRVLDLARALAPGVEIVFTGLRDGEKLTESLVGSDEVVEAESAEGLRVVRPDLENRETVESLRDALEQRNRAALLAGIQRMVPDYIPSRAIAQWVNA